MTKTIDHLTDLRETRRLQRLLPTSVQRTTYKFVALMLHVYIAYVLRGHLPFLMVPRFLNVEISRRWGTVNSVTHVLLYSQPHHPSAHGCVKILYMCTCTCSCGRISCILYQFILLVLRDTCAMCVYKMNCT